MWQICNKIFNSGSLFLRLALLIHAIVRHFSLCNGSCEVLLVVVSMIQMYHPSLVMVDVANNLHCCGRV